MDENDRRSALKPRICSKISRRKPACRSSATDEPLVRSYLEHFLVDANDTKQFARYVNDQYLRQVFAETKIVNGLGDAERLYSMLSPEEYQQLKERIDLDFAYTNKTELSADDPVALDLYVKNVDTLIVKVFEINTQNYYREHLGEISPDINLDGLVANDEKTYTYHEPPLRRVLRHFEFPHTESSRRLRRRFHRQRQSQPGRDPQRKTAIRRPHQLGRANLHDLR